MIPVRKSRREYRLPFAYADHEEPRLMSAEREGGRESRADNADLTGLHGSQRRPVRFGADARTAACINGDVNLREKRLQNQRVGDNADIGTYADDLDLRDLPAAEQGSPIGIPEGRLVDMHAVGAVDLPDDLPASVPLMQCGTGRCLPSFVSA